MSQQPRRSTSEIELIVQKLIEQQVRICEERRGRQGDRVSGLAETIGEVRSGLAELKKTVDADSEAQQEKMTTILVAVERNNTRWAFFRVLSAVVSALGAIAGITGLIASLANSP